MGARPGQIQSVQHEPVSSLAVQRTPCEELIEAGLGMLDVTAGEAVVVLEVLRRDDLASFDQFESWVADTERLLAGCPCESGCPSCVQSPKCGNLNEFLDKAGALVLLRRMLTAATEK